MSTVIPKISKLSERVIRVLGCNPGPFTLQGTNTYLIGTGSNRILLDTGEAGNNEYVNVLKDVLKSNQIKLCSIIITHWHHDHIGGLVDVLALLDPSKDCKVHKFKYDKQDPKDDKINFDYLNDGQKIEVEGSTLRIYHTPGHTEDHAVVYLDEEKALFSGDCILGEGSAIFEDLKDYLASLEKIAFFKPSKIYPGHGPEVLEPISKINEYISHRLAREKQILDCIKSYGDKGVTVDEMVSTIYKDTPKHLHPAAASNVSHHLTKLLKDKSIESIDSPNDKAHYWIRRKNH